MDRNRKTASYKLTYFDSRGRGEPCRLLFVLAGQSFEDVRIPIQDWPKVKPTTPFGQLPVLEIDGKVYTQSNALASFLAKEFGYYGKTNIERLEIDQKIERLEIDQIVYLLSDLIQELYKFFFETDHVKKAEVRKHFVDAVMPRYLGFFEKVLTENGSGYFVGASLTLADLVVYDFVSDCQQLLPDGALQTFPLMKALLERIESNDRIKTYIADRKSTKF